MRINFWILAVLVGLMGLAFHLTYEAKTQEERAPLMAELAQQCEPNK